MLLPNDNQWVAGCILEHPKSDGKALKQASRRTRDSSISSRIIASLQWNVYAE